MVAEPGKADCAKAGYFKAALPQDVPKLVMVKKVDVGFVPVHARVAEEAVRRQDQQHATRSQHTMPLFEGNLVVRKVLHDVLEGNIIERSTGIGEACGIRAEQWYGGELRAGVGKPPPLRIDADHPRQPDHRKEGPDTTADIRNPARSPREMTPNPSTLHLEFNAVAATQEVPLDPIMQSDRVAGSYDGRAHDDRRPNRRSVMPMTQSSTDSRSAQSIFKPNRLRPQ